MRLNGTQRRRLNHLVRLRELTAELSTVLVALVHSLPLRAGIQEVRPPAVEGYRALGRALEPLRELSNLPRSEAGLSVLQTACEVWSECGLVFEFLQHRRLFEGEEGKTYVRTRHAWAPFPAEAPRLVHVAYTLGHPEIRLNNFTSFGGPDPKHGIVFPPSVQDASGLTRPLSRALALVYVAPSKGKTRLALELCAAPEVVGLPHMDHLIVQVLHPFVGGDYDPVAGPDLEQLRHAVDHVEAYNPPGTVNSDHGRMRLIAELCLGRSADRKGLIQRSRLERKRHAEWLPTLLSEAIENLRRDPSPSTVSSALRALEDAEGLNDRPDRAFLAAKIHLLVLLGKPLDAALAAWQDAPPSPWPKHRAFLQPPWYRVYDPGLYRFPTEPPDARSQLWLPHPE